MIQDEAIKKVTSPLRREKVEVKPILRKGGWLQDIDKDHDGAFMFTGTFFRLRGVPVDVNSKVRVQPLTSNEQAWFESPASGLDLAQGDLSVYKMKDNYWDRFEVKLSKDGLTLDKSNPMDYLKYKFLLAHSNLICGNPDLINTSQEFKFMLVEEGFEVIDTNKRAELKKRSWIEFGKIESSIEKLSNVLVVFGKRPPANAKIDWLRAQVSEMIEKSPKEFLAIVEDPTMQIKLMIQKAITVGAIIQSGKTKYILPGGDEIGNSLQGVIDYLEDKANNVNYIQIKAQIEANQ